MAHDLILFAGGFLAGGSSVAVAVRWMVTPALRRLADVERTVLDKGDA